MALFLPSGVTTSKLILQRLLYDQIKLKSASGELGDVHLGMIDLTRTVPTTMAGIE